MGVFRKDHDNVFTFAILFAEPLFTMEHLGKHHVPGMGIPIINLEVGYTVLV